jgi:hypothetical protein
MRNYLNIEQRILIYGWLCIEKGIHFSRLFPLMRGIAPQKGKDPPRLHEREKCDMKYCITPCVAMQESERWGMQSKCKANVLGRTRERAK